MFSVDFLFHLSLPSIELFIPNSLFLFSLQSLQSEFFFNLFVVLLSLGMIFSHCIEQEFCSELLPHEVLHCFSLVDRFAEIYFRVVLHDERLGQFFLELLSAIKDVASELMGDCHLLILGGSYCGHSSISLIRTNLY